MPWRGRWPSFLAPFRSPLALLRTRYSSLMGRLARPRTLGQRGEDLAARYLRSLGYKIIARSDRAVLGELEVECGRIDVRYDEAPVVRYARGSKDVTVRLKGIEAKAATLEVDVARRSVRLQGGVKVSRGRGWVTAEAAQIDIATRHVTLDDVKGSIPVQAPAR